MGKHYLLKLFSFFISVSLVGSALAVPDNTMSVAPAATSGEVITAADENARNSEISTKYNAHGHGAVSSTTANTFTIGDAAAGNKTYAVDDDQAADPSLRFNTTSDKWFLSMDGSSFLAMAHASTTSGLTSGTILVGQDNGSILALGPGSNGQILIARTSGAPELGNITATPGITVTNGGGSIVIGRNAIAGSFTRDTATADGTQTITGVGFKPKSITFNFYQSATAGRAGWSFSTSPTNTSGMFDAHATTASTYDTFGASQIIYSDQGGGNYTTATITQYTSDGFVILWDRVSSPTGTLNVQYLAE